MDGAFNYMRMRMHSIVIMSTTINFELLSEQW